MAVTWAASAPHADAVKNVGSSFGAVGVVATLPNQGGKRRVLTQFTATGTYTAGGDTLDAAALGLSEVHSLQVVAGSDTDYDTVNVFDSAPALAGTAKLPLIKLLDAGADVAAASTVTGFNFHAIVEGV